MEAPEPPGRRLGAGPEAAAAAFERGFTGASVRAAATAVAPGASHAAARGGVLTEKRDETLR